MTDALLFIRAHWRAILILLLLIALVIWASIAIHAYGQRQYQAGRTRSHHQDRQLAGIFRELR